MNYFPFYELKIFIVLFLNTGTILDRSPNPVTDPISLLFISQIFLNTWTSDSCVWINILDAKQLFCFSFTLNLAFIWNIYLL